MRARCRGVPRRAPVDGHVERFRNGRRGRCHSGAPRYDPVRGARAMTALTPLAVRKKKGDFKRAMRGYDPGTGDDFIELVADRLEELVRANLSHTDRLRQLEQQVRDYQERERALTEALVSAQELREEMRE